MNPASLEDAEKIARRVITIGSKLTNVITVLCPPTLYFSAVARFIKDKKVVAGVQNIFAEPKGSYTGEVSVEMIKNAGAKYVIIGHSERRKMGEDG